MNSKFKVCLMDSIKFSGGSTFGWNRTPTLKSQYLIKLSFIIWDVKGFTQRRNCDKFWKWLLFHLCHNIIGTHVISVGESPFKWYGVTLPGFTAFIPCWWWQCTSVQWTFIYLYNIEIVTRTIPCNTVITNLRKSIPY